MNIDTSLSASNTGLVCGHPHVCWPNFLPTSFLLNCRNHLNHNHCISFFFFSQIILIKLTVSSKSAITGKPPYFTCLNCLPLSLLVRCWRWDPLLNLLPSGGIRHVLFWSATHVEFMVCPNEFANNRRLYCWRIISHAVKPTMPEGGERRQLWRGRAACWGGGAILLLELES